jgi:hypothetical protein
VSKSGSTLSRPSLAHILLNIHTRFHSSSRPEFCAVFSCSRRPRRKEYKQKNKIQWVLQCIASDNSNSVVSGPNQAHIHLRPDNLQRYIRVTHVDKLRPSLTAQDTCKEASRSGKRHGKEYLFPAARAERDGIDKRIHIIICACGLNDDGMLDLEVLPSQSVIFVVCIVLVLSIISM